MPQPKPANPLFVIRKIKLISLIWFCTSAPIYAQKNASAEVIYNSQNGREWFFEENMGQLEGTNGQPAPDIKYYGTSDNIGMYCATQKISFIFSHNLTGDTYKQPT